MTKEPSKLGGIMKVCLAFSISMLLVASGMFLLSQLLRSEVSSGGASGPLGNETLPDLSISPADIWFSDDFPVEGDKIYIFAIVHNIGGSPAYNVTVEFWDDVCEGCPAFYLIGTDFWPMISPGGVGNTSVLWNTSGQPGNNTITVIVDPDNTIQESDETNNEASRTIYVRPASDFPPYVMVRKPNGGERWTGGSDHYISWVMNDLSDDSLYVQIYYSGNGGVSWTLISEGVYPNGDRFWVWEVPEVDTDVALIRVCATDSDNLTSCDESDDDFIIDSTPPSILVADPPDGAIGVPTDYPLMVIFDEPMNTTSVNEAFSINPYVGGLVFIWSLDNSALTIAHYPFQPNETYFWGFTCEAKDASSPGNVLSACPFYLIFETGEGNDTGPDLTLESADIYISDDSPDAGQTIYICASIHNIGTQDAYNVTVQFADLFLVNRTVIAEEIVAHIPAGYFANVSTFWVAGPPGFHIIEVFADPYDTIPEINEDNNIARRGVMVDGDLDIDLTLAPSDIYFDDDNPDEGELVMIWAHIHNIGTHDAYDVVVQFVDWFEGGSTPLPEAIIDHIPAGSYGNATTIWPAMPSGNHTIEVTIDPHDWIPETNESNNVASRKVLVGEGEYQVIVGAITFDNDDDGRYDDVVIMVCDSDNHAVQGASIYVDSIYYGKTADTGLLVLLNFSLGTHQVLAIFGSHSDTATFYSEG